MPVRTVLTAAAAAAAAATVTAALAAPAHAQERGPAVPGAEKQVSARLDDLTTAGTIASGHTVPADFAGLHAAGTRNPTGVPGIQVDGYFPDTSAFNTNNGWNHDAQFVIRLPDRWNGGLVVAGSPGNRRQYANDVTISDWALGKGYAYAATDKGNSGLEFYKDGRRPGDAVAEWNQRLTQLTRAAKKVARRHYGKAPRSTFAAGISNGGYLVRWQLENHPELYDGGIDAEGTLWRADGPNLFTYLPAILRAYPSYAATGDPSAHKALLKAGLAPGSEFLWPFHDQVYWELTQRIYREEFDPTYTGAEADYDYAARPEKVHRAVARISLTGRIGKPLITLQGTYDSLLPISTDSDVYAKLVRARGKAPYRYYRLEAANHVDGLYDTYPDRLRPLLPCMRTAFTALESWTRNGTPPPASATLPRPASGDLVNTCSLTS
ncbi:tannase/feruloyl esterase family alpha/beta hydrolase [Actinomadura bangladeshensis]|uniref:Tannase/feruloyl esterase family alpha/beta hydrolase n=1 Tax=Actinomadura bangladeshensis TaxID=453573 RepID=A0A6L9QU96_9ACTN|nr:tannase/feruloyl esterase family alpha/beta hydrolase [Actinomadura bangladeshensis]NEA29059.1 tannase/feruloyl esterase family alpha/beta hydrolase [Actinomadura bangladeshensis]